MAANVHVGFNEYRTAALSEAAPPLGIANHHGSHQNHPSQRLSLHLAQFSGLAQMVPHFTIEI